jgi:hypothetical protein
MAGSRFAEQLTFSLLAGAHFEHSIPCGPTTAALSLKKINSPHPDGWQARRIEFTNSSDVISARGLGRPGFPTVPDLLR